MRLLYDELRKRHENFIYHDFELKARGLSFHFQLSEYHFFPEWEFPFELSKEQQNNARVRLCAFSLGMAELVSYWKCACPKKVEVRCGSLSEKQALWWKKLYFNGLGEFFYRNGIEADFDDFMEISADGESAKCELSRELSGALVPVGGGKDSAVTLELLKKAGEDITPFCINERKAISGCVEAAGIAPEKTVRMKRTIDKTLLELNKKGYLNGHTPFSAVVAFSAMLAAVILGKKYIVLSNESSANETYVEGRKINHQYSKSTEFERDFREYAREYLGDCPEYFSLLRPLSELQIAREFVKYPRYFPVFQSCNLGGKTDVWCCDCAKCLYTYILLAAFLPDDELIKIFGCDMLEKENLAATLDGLMLDGEDKPFECVGTKNEVRAALYKALEMRKENPPALLKRFSERFEDYKPADIAGYFDRDNFVPEKFISYVEMTAK